MRFKQYLVEYKDVTLPKIYPDFELPAKDKDIQELYKEFNKKYFRNQLSQKVRIKFAPLAKNFAGKAHIKYDGNGKISDMLITMATMFKNNRAELVDTMLHEMIHIWQRMEAEKTGNNRLLDIGFFDMGEENLKGHGTHFKQQMDRLNNVGFNITTQSDSGMGVELTKPLYGVLFTTDMNLSVVVYTPTDPTKHLDTIIKELEERMGDGFYTDVHVIKTKDNLIMQTTRLTKQFKLPKNQINITYSPDAVDLLLDSSYTKVLLNQKPIETSTTTDNTIRKDVPAEVIQLLPRIHKHRASSFSSYWGTVTLNHPVWSKIKGKDKEEYEKNHPEMQAAKEYTKKDWMEIADIEAKKGFIGLEHQLLKAIKSEDKKLGEQDIKNLKYDYESKFKERMDLTRFKKILTNAAIIALKKFIKKFKHSAAGAGLTEDKLEMVINKILSNSGF